MLLRASVRDPGLLAAPDGILIEAVHRALAGVLGIAGGPALARVARHPGVMPRYALGHLTRVAAVEDALTVHPALQVVGAAYHRAGLPECVAQGQLPAERAVARLRAAA